MNLDDNTIQIKTIHQTNIKTPFIQKNKPNNQTLIFSKLPKKAPLVNILIKNVYNQARYIIVTAPMPRMQPGSSTLINPTCYPPHFVSLPTFHQLEIQRHFAYGRVFISKNPLEMSLLLKRYTLLKWKRKPKYFEQCGV